MELRPADVPALDDGGEGLPVRAGSDAVLTDGGGIAMHEVRPGISCNPIQEVRRLPGLQDVPTHVRHPNAGCRGKPTHASSQQAQALDVAFLGRLEENLHAEADTKQRHPRCPQRLIETALPQQGHRGRRGADARQDDPRRMAQVVGIRRQSGMDAQALKREAD